MKRRPVAAAIASAAVIVLGSASLSAAAVQRAALSRDSAPPGASVTLRVDTTARIAGAAPGTLIIVPSAAFERAPEVTRCDAIDGAMVLGHMTWRAAPVEFAGTSYPGFVGDAAFTVPAAPDGEYYLTESIDATGTGCHVFASFLIAASPLPDTTVRATDVGLPVLLLLVAACAAVAILVGGLPPRTAPTRGR